MHTIESEATLAIVRLPEIRVGHVTLPVYRGNDDHLYTELEKLLQSFSLHPKEQIAALITHPLLGEGVVMGLLEGDKDPQPLVLIRADMLAMFLANLNLRYIKTDGAAYEVVRSIQWEAAQVLAEAFVSGRLMDGVRITYQASQ